MIINGTTVRAFGYLALSCFQAKYPNPNRNSFWQVAVSWEFFQILRALFTLTRDKKAHNCGMQKNEANFDPKSVTIIIITSNMIFFVSPAYTAHW